MPENPPAAQPPKIIALFSDGTGNSAAKLAKTNVWRLFQAVDQRDPTDEQVADGASIDGSGRSRCRTMR